jgi:hypothetical protein
VLVKDSGSWRSWCRRFGDGAKSDAACAVASFGFGRKLVGRVAVRIGSPRRDVPAGVEIPVVLDVRRASAPETAYGCAEGTKLWRAKPHERIRHETRPAGTGRIEAPGG